MSKKIYGSIDELVGRTPLLRLERYEREISANCEIVAKLEYFNPGGSVKDRVARQMLDRAKENGLINERSTIIEPTSGNTGIGLAMIAAARGLRAVIVMPDNMSKERRQLLRALGAELVLTDAALGMAGAIARADELVREIDGAILAGQFTNPENPMAHRLTTAPEIYEDTDGEIDYFVCGVGTGGTISGVGEYLKERIPDIKIIAVEPAGSPVLSGGERGAHNLQGIGAGFIPKILNRKIIDEIITVKENDAYLAARQLGRCEGALVGISSGAALFAAAEIAKREESKGGRIVVLLPDTGERYLSSELFDI